MSASKPFPAGVAQMRLHAEICAHPCKHDGVDAALAEPYPDIVAPEPRELLVWREDERVVVRLEFRDEVSTVARDIERPRVKRDLIGNVQMRSALVLGVLVLVWRVEHGDVALAGGVAVPCDGV